MLSFEQIYFLCMQSKLLINHKLDFCVIEVCLIDFAMLQGILHVPLEISTQIIATRVRVHQNGCYW